MLDVEVKERERESGGLAGDWGCLQLVKRFVNVVQGTETLLKVPRYTAEASRSIGNDRGRTGGPGGLPRSRAAQSNGILRFA